MGTSQTRQPQQAVTPTNVTGVSLNHRGVDPVRPSTPTISSRPPSLPCHRRRAVSSQVSEDRLWNREGDELCGCSWQAGPGCLGRRLVPQLVARGHQVTATTTSPAKLGLLEQLGAEAVVMDGLDAVSVGEAVAAARPDAIVHQMTAISMAHAGKPDMKHMDRLFATTNRLRTEGTDHLLAAAEATGVSTFVAQSFGSLNGIRQGGWVKTEEDPLDPLTGTVLQPMAEAVRHLEDAVVKAGGAALRYGAFYGPGATDDQVELVRKRQFPLVGGGTGYSSWVHLDDAASATVLAVEQQATGVFNIVDDEPAPASRVAALSGRVRGGEAADAGPQVAGPAAGRGRGGDDDDRGARLLQRQGQARARLGAALPVVAPGLQGGAGMTRAEEFEELRPLLFAIAYRILGSVSEAEDAVQETWLRYEASPTQPTSTKAFLSAVVTRISIDVLRSARVRREEYVGPWFPEPLLTDPYEDPERSAELADSVSMAALLLLERLSPLERAVFVLREVFGFGFPEVASAVGRSEAACRQLAVRARRHMDAGALGSRRTAGSGRNWRRGSSTRSGKATSTACGSCSPPTFRWSGTAAARPRSWPGASSAPTRWPGCLPRSSPGSSGSA